MKKGTYEDQIRIEELEVYAHHGVYPEENEKGQHFYVNATLYTNTRPAGLQTHFNFLHATLVADLQEKLISKMSMHL